MALSITASNEPSLKFIVRTSICWYLRTSPFYLYFSAIALTTSPQMSILVIFPYPSSAISSLNLEFPAPTFRILYSLSMLVVMISLSPLYRWYQSKGSVSLQLGDGSPCVSLVPVLGFTVLTHLAEEWNLNKYYKFKYQGYYLKWKLEISSWIRIFYWIFYLAYLLTISQYSLLVFLAYFLVELTLNWYWIFHANFWSGFRQGPDNRRVFTFYWYYVYRSGWSANIVIVHPCYRI